MSDSNFEGYWIGAALLLGLVAGAFITYGFMGRGMNP